MLHLNSRGQRAPLASISPHATSESEDSGQHDKLPVCNQNVPGAERFLYAVLPWPIYQEPGLCVSNAQAVRAATVSLCCTCVPQGDGHPCTECLLATCSIPRTDVPVQRQFLPLSEARGLLGAIGERAEASGTLTTAQGTIPDIGRNYCSLLQKSDGYGYIHTRGGRNFLPIA